MQQNIVNWKMQTTNVSLKFSHKQVYFGLQMEKQDWSYDPPKQQPSSWALPHIPAVHTWQPS